MEKLPSSRLQANWRPHFRSDSQAGARRSRWPVPSRKSSAAKIKKHKARECGRRSGVAFFFGSAFARTAILVCQAERTTQGVEQRVARGVAVGLPVLFGGRQRES